MALISTIGAGIYSELQYKELTSDIQDAFDAVAATTTNSTAQTAYDTATTGLKAEVGTLSDIKNIRDFPSFGAPANIVNVPVYGQAVSSQIQGQADAPTLEFNLNYVPSEAATVQNLVDDDKSYLFKLNLKNGTSGDNAAFFVIGQFAAFSVAPNLTDSNQATLTILTTSDYVGPLAD